MAASPDRLSADLLLARRNPWRITLSLSPLLIVAAAAAVGLPLLTISFVASLLVLACLVSLRRACFVLERVHVRVDEHALDLGGQRLPITGIREALVAPGPAPRVILRRRGLAPPLELRVSSLVEGRALLRAIGHDPSRTTFTFRTNAAPARVLISAALLVVFGAGAWLAPSLMVTAPFFAFCALYALRCLGVMATALLYREHIAVGPDGVRHLQGWVWKQASSFIGYRNIAAVSPNDEGMSLRLRSGGEVRFEIAPALKLHGAAPRDEAQATIIEERIRHAMEIVQREDGMALSSLRRGERSPRAWLDALRALGTGANVDMRTAPVSRERLLEIVESPLHSTVDRAAAAVALGAALDDDVRARLRRVSAKTVDESLARMIDDLLTGAEVQGPRVNEASESRLATTLMRVAAREAKQLAGPSSSPMREKQAEEEALAPEEAARRALPRLGL